jgi:ubiquinone/menaquinone biosynthesis C-methylase UbiE
MRDVLEGTEMNTLVISELAVTHVSVVLDDFSDMLRREILHICEYSGTVGYNVCAAHLLAHIDVASFTFLTISFSLHLHPFLSLLCDD